METSQKVLIVSRCTWNLFAFRKNLIRTLLHEGFEVAVAASATDGYLNKVEALGVRCYVLPLSSGSMNPLKELRLIRALIGVYSDFEPDIIHHFTIKPVIFGSIAARIAGRQKVINTITGLGYAFTSGGWLVERVAAALYRIALSTSSHVFFQNSDDRDMFVRRGLTTRLISSLVAGSGVDLDYFSATREAAQGDEPVSFLFVGRVLRDKGIEEFIAAAEVAKQRGIVAEFRILGKIDESNPSVVDKSEFRSAIERVGIEWLGHTDDVRSRIDAADVVVLPSYREGTPRSLLEGAAMSRAIITTDVAGCRTVIDANKTGIAVPVKSVGELADAFVKLSRDRELLISMGKAGRKKMEREFSELDVIDKTIAQYRRE